MRLPELRRDRPMKRADRLAGKALRLKKHLLHPARTLERLRKGPLFGSA